MAFNEKELQGSFAKKLTALQQFIHKFSTCLSTGDGIGFCFASLYSNVAI